MERVLVYNILRRFQVYGKSFPQWCKPLLSFLRALLGIIECICNVEVFLCRGVVRGGDRLSTALYIGPKESAYNFADVVYSKILWVSLLGKLPAFRVDPSRLPNVDITAACVGKPLVGKFLKRNFLVLPVAEFSLDLRRPMNDIMERLSRRRRRDLAKLARYNYSWTVHKDNEKDFDFFYWKMYYPYVTRRFGRAASITSYLESKACYFHNGGIISVNREEKPVAGILFQIREKTLYALNLGIYEGNQELLSDLAGQAALFFLIKWAQMKDLESLNYGLTAPFLRDGLFQYKKEWGMSVEGRTSPIYCLLRVNVSNKDAISMLPQNPFIFVDKGLMKGVIFVEHDATRKELEQISSEYLSAKLDSLIIIACGDHNPDVCRSNAFCEDRNFSHCLAKPLLNICIRLVEQGLEVRVFERFKASGQLSEFIP
jgi:hypothetical protein